MAAGDAGVLARRATIGACAGPARRARSMAALAALAVAGAALAGGPPPAWAAGTSAEVLLVDANADGDTPVSGGVARVSACPRRDEPSAPLRQRDGAGAERTNRAGVALLDFPSLPSCFVVEVSGGRVNGKALHGAFRAEARNRAGRIMSVQVTPVTTLISDERQAHPDIGAARAVRAIRRLLRIPGHFDTIDLAADDRPFDGDAYMRAAVRAGSVGTLNRRLIRAADRRQRQAFPGRSPHAARGAAADPTLPAIQKWWEDNDVTKLVTDGLKSFGASIALDVAASGGKWILGRLLNEWGLKGVADFLLPKPDTQKIIEMISELTRKVNNLQATSDAILKKVAGLQFQQAVAQARPLINSVKTIQTDVLELAKTDPADPGRVGASERILSLIGAELEPNRSFLDHLMTESGDGGIGILRAASEKVSQDRWFTPADSRSVRAVYEYFAVYQLRLASLLVEYWNTRSCSNTPAPPKCLSPTGFIQPNFDRFGTQIGRQEATLKPPLPDTVFIDTRTMRMWPLKSWLVKGAPALKTVAIWQGMRCTGTRSPTCTGSQFSPYPLPLIMSTGHPGLGPWTDWHFPTEADYRGLIEDWKGDSPLEWLHRGSGFTTTPMRRFSPWTAASDRDRVHGHLWMSTSFRPSFSGLYVYRANLSQTDEPGPHVWYEKGYYPRERDGSGPIIPPDRLDFSNLDQFDADMTIWRSVPPDEYFWK